MVYIYYMYTIKILLDPHALNAQPQLYVFGLTLLPSGISIHFIVRNERNDGLDSWLV